MKKYERIVLRVDEAATILKPIIVKKAVVIKLHDMVEYSINQPKPYRGDYYASDTPENKDGS